MVIEKIQDLNPANQRAIIINYNTKHVAFLALLSVLKHAKIPVLLIDCNSTDGSLDFFKSKMLGYHFDLLSAPLQTHGLTLDWIFSSSNDDKILLVDSDLEILNPRLLDFFNEFIDEPSVFGCSFLMGPESVSDKKFKGTLLEGALLYERPFIPISLFKVEHIKEALKLGISFASVLVDNECGIFSKTKASIVKQFFRIIKCKTPISFRKKYFDGYPKKVFYDTGAKMYEYLYYKRNLYLASIPHTLQEKYVCHFWGTTRKKMNENHLGGTIEDLDSVVLTRLKQVYGEELNCSEC